MADFLAFNEGLSEVISNGLPSTAYFALSTKSVDATSAHTASETLAGADFGEITGTGYARQSQSEPSPADGLVTFAEMTWSTGAASDWPSAVRSVVLCTGAAGTGKVIASWNLQASGVARDLSQPNTTQRFTPTLTLSD